MAPERPSDVKRKDPRFAVSPSVSRIAFKPTERDPRQAPVSRPELRIPTNPASRSAHQDPPIYATGDVQRAAGGLRAVRDARDETLRGEGSIPGYRARRRARAGKGRDLRTPRVNHQLRSSQTIAERVEREAAVGDRRVAREAKRREDHGHGRRE